MSLDLAGKTRIRPMTPQDGVVVLEIYGEGIASGDATFLPSPPSWDQWDRSHCPSCRFICETATAIAGWAALSPVASPCHYQGVAEVSIYVATAHQGQGIGRALLSHLLKEAGKEGFWTIQASIFPENTASLHMHQACGFRVVGRRERIGFMESQQRWRDTTLLEIRLPEA